MISDNFPHLPEAVVAELEARFPDRAPKLTDTEREVWAKVGEVRVVRFLREIVNLQKDSLLTDVHVQAPEG